MSDLSRTNQDLPAALEQQLKSPPAGRYTLRLYVSGATRRSTRAIENLKRLCEQHLAGRYELEVIDIYQKPVLARDGEILAAPTLVKELPEPLRRLVGDLSDEARVLRALDIRAAADGKKIKSQHGER